MFEISQNTVLYYMLYSKLFTAKKQRGLYCLAEKPDCIITWSSYRNPFFICMSPVHKVFGSFT